MKIGLCAVNSKYIHTNLALRYFLNKFKQFNMELQEYTINDNLRYVASSIYDGKFDVVVFSCYIWNIDFVIELAEILKKANNSIKVVLGGPEVSFNSEKIMKNNSFIDYISCGEGEVNLPQLFNYMISGTPSKEIIDGLSYRSEKSIITNKGYPALENLDELPFPYSDEELKNRNKILYYEASRGCPFNCSYCLSSITRGVRAISMEKFRDDMLKFIDANVKLVKFVDRTANFSKQRFKEMLLFLKNNSRSTTFHFEIAAHLLDDETLKILGSLPEGLVQLEIGVQSTNSKTIDVVDRKTDFDKIAYSIKKIVSYDNIHVHADLIAGLPEEDYESFKESFNYLYNLRPQCIQLGFLKVLYGSEMRNQTDTYGIEFTKNAPYEVIKTNLISFEQLSKLKVIDYLVDKYYNSSSFKNIIEYILIVKSFKPFELWDNFADFFMVKYGLSKKYSLDYLYHILYNYCANSLELDEFVLSEILKFDYAAKAKPTAFPEWYKVEYEKDKLIKQNKLKEYKYPNKFLETFNIDVIKFITSREVHIEKIYVDFTYSKGNTHFRRVTF